MGKTLIKVRCTDQELFILNAPVITSGGKNEDAIEFDFCPLWDDFEKFATFYRDRDTVYHVRIVDNRCIIPHEVLKDEGWVHFGVFGEKDGAIRTSGILKYHIEFGVPLEGIEPLEPTPDLWEQILATTVTAEAVEGGHKVTIAVGGNSESFTVMDGQNGEDAPVPEISVETVQGGHKVIAAVGDTVKSFTVKDGVDGKDGDDAPIPEIKVETISGGHKVTASVGNTVQSFNVMDGKDGKTPVKGVDYFDGKDGYTPVKGKDYFDGKDGYSPVKNKDYFDGKDGISPVINVTDIENGHRVTITTGSDVQSFDVLNGKDGEGGGGGTSTTDLETIAMLADNDLLPTITDGSGKILTDAKNTIMLRY